MTNPFPKRRSSDRGPAVRDLKEVECRHPIGSEDREGATTASKRYRLIVAHKTRSPASWHVGITDQYRAARRERHGCGCRTGSRHMYDARESRSSMARRPSVRCSVTTPTQDRKSVVQGTSV